MLQLTPLFSSTLHRLPPRPRFGCTFWQNRPAPLPGRIAEKCDFNVVYVDAIAGKTFAAPKDHPVIDQKGLMFAPHIVVVQQGTTVDFLNSDNVAHNVFWPSVAGDKKQYRR